MPIAVRPANFSWAASGDAAVAARHSPRTIATHRWQWNVIFATETGSIDAFFITYTHCRGQLTFQICDAFPKCNAIWQRLAQSEFVIFICGFMNVSLFNAQNIYIFFAHAFWPTRPNTNVPNMRAITLCYRLRYRLRYVCTAQHPHTLVCLVYAHKSCGPCRACLGRV